MKALSRLRAGDAALLLFLAYCAARIAYLATADGASESLPRALSSWLTYPEAQILLSLLAALLMKLVRPLYRSAPAGAPARAWPAAILVLTGLALASYYADSETFHRLRHGLAALLVTCGAVISIQCFRSSGARPFALDEWAGWAAGGIRREARRWGALLVLLSAYPLVPLIIARGSGGDLDSRLARLDNALFLGHDPQKLVARLIWPPLSEWMSLCYSTYGLLFIGAAMLFCLRDDEEPLDWLIAAVTVTLAAGYVGYSLVPAVGPLFTQAFSVPLSLPYTGQLKEQVIDRARIARDCFPSLHTAIALVVLEANRRYSRPAFWATLPLLLTIPVACVYLRYHYVVDVLAGALLAAAVALCVKR